MIRRVSTLSLAVLLAVIAVGVCMALAPTSARAADPIERLELGGDTSCALFESGRVQCWGANDADQATPPERLFASLSLGDRHACGLTRTDGVPELLCWGANGHGQAEIPRWVQETRRCTGAVSTDCGGFIEVRAGSNTTCALADRDDHISFSSDNVIETNRKCWGETDSGDWTWFTGVRMSGYESTPRPRLWGVGEAHACWSRNAALLCTGDNPHGQTDAPESEFIQVTVGDVHNCGRTSAGALRCWGGNLYGQSAPPDGRYSWVAAGEQHSCAVHVSGELRCWGRDQHDQASAPLGTDWVQVAAGQRHSCALTDGGLVWCWGGNQAGQTNVPAAIAAPPPPGATISDAPETDHAAMLDAVEVEVRINARWLADGRVEFALQYRLADGTWSERILPRGRRLPTGAAIDRWLSSTPILIPPPNGSG